MKNESIVVLHPLSYERGMLVPVLNFLTSRDSLIGLIKEVSICETTASVLNIFYNESGWSKSIKTVLFYLYTDRNPDDLIGREDARYCGLCTLKGRFYNNNLSKFDKIVLYTKNDSELKLYKDLFKV